VLGVLLRPSTIPREHRYVSAETLPRDVSARRYSVTVDTCELCADPIEAGQARMERADPPAVAHSGCVYSDAAPDDRDAWMPAGMGSDEGA